MVFLQYLKVLIKIWIAKNQGYNQINAAGRLYPKTQDKLKEKGYRVKQNEGSFLFKAHFDISWGVEVI